MRFAPKTDSELAAMDLIQPGQYHFEVIEAKDRQSKAGNDMVELKLKVWDQDGRERVMFDYLLEAMPKKLKHFCDVANLEHEYKSGFFSADHCFNKSGVIDVIIQEDKTGQYQPKNSVRDYIKKENMQPKASAPKQEEELFNDDIPF